MFEGEVDAEDELPVRDKKKKTRSDYVSFASCLNNAVSCYFIDLGMPVARCIRDETVRTRAYMKQVEMVALHKQTVLPSVASSLSMGQLAAVLLNRNIICDLTSTRIIVASLCFEETTPETPLCLVEPGARSYDVDEVCMHLVECFEVSPLALERYGRKFMQTETMCVIREWYPNGCAQCIFNLSALMIKTTLCYTTIASRTPRIFDRKLPVLSDLACSIACGYAFGSNHVPTKHRLMHLIQTSMLLEQRFSSVCVNYSNAIDDVLQLRVYRQLVRVKAPHVNQDNCLLTAIARYMNYDMTLVTPYICVVMHIANEMFSSTGSDNIKFFIRPQKRVTGHCILKERSSGRVVYHS